MKTYKQAGEVIPLTAPAGGVVSGTAYQIGLLVVIATATVVEGLPFEALVVGVVDVPKLAEEGWTECLKIYWDDAAKVFTATAGANQLVGVAIPPIVPLSVSITSTALAADLAIDNAALTIQVLDWATLAAGAPTITIVVNGVTTVLTEGTEWTAAVSDEGTAGSIASAIDALTGVESAAPAGDTVTVIPTTGVLSGSASIGRVRLDGAVR